MQIVTDSGVDIPAEQLAKLDMDIHFVPLVVTLDGKSYREDVDIQPGEFYRLLAETGSLPTTSQPSAGDFAEVYRRLATTDPDILSIHMSSGLSGTVNSARAGVKLVPEANVTVVDTKTLAGAPGWQIEAAVRALKAGWSKEQILALMERVGAATDSIYTLQDLKYLIHGGRISQLGQARTFKGAVKGLVKIMAAQHAPGSEMRVQVLHSYNPEGAAELREQIDQRFDCTWMPGGFMSLVLGAHTGPSMVGVAYASLADYPDLP